MYKFERVLESLVTAPLNELRQSRSEFRGCLAVSKAYENFCNTFVQLHLTKTNEMKFEFSDCPYRVQAKVLKKV